MNSTSSSTRLLHLGEPLLDLALVRAGVARAVRRSSSSPSSRRRVGTRWSASSTESVSSAQRWIDDEGDEALLRGREREVDGAVLVELLVEVEERPSQVVRRSSSGETAAPCSSHAGEEGLARRGGRGCRRVRWRGRGCCSGGPRRGRRRGPLRRSRRSGRGRRRGRRRRRRWAWVGRGQVRMEEEGRRRGGRRRAGPRLGRRSRGRGRGGGTRRRARGWIRGSCTRRRQHVRISRLQSHVESEARCVRRPPP